MYRNFLASTTLILVAVVFYILPSPSKSFALQPAVAQAFPQGKKIVSPESVITTVKNFMPDDQVDKTLALTTLENNPLIIPQEKSVKQSQNVVPENSRPLKADARDIGSSGANSQTKTKTKVHKVPFFSQFTDITPVEWRKVGCGIASVAMLIDFYKPGEVSIDALLQDGIKAGVFLSDAGWTHAGLIALSNKFGLTGESHSLADLGMESAFDELEDTLEEGPVMASVHYTFDPNNPIPHLVVVNGVSDGKVFYNDPAEDNGGGALSIAKFKSAWKKRFIEIRPS
ncbi:C39 family peptidase [Candidatus Kaiserbacteria bacterium]|nr:C39 family peptidase [Candidatus Kaiserbacteria bacterium]